MSHNLTVLSSRLGDKKKVRVQIVWNGSIFQIFSVFFFYVESTIAVLPEWSFELMNAYKQLLIKLGLFIWLVPDFYVFYLYHSYRIVFLNGNIGKFYCLENLRMITNSNFLWKKWVEETTKKLLILYIYIYHKVGTLMLFCDFLYFVEKCRMKYKYKRKT